MRSTSSMATGYIPSGLITTPSGRDTDQLSLRFKKKKEYHWRRNNNP